MIGYICLDRYERGDPNGLLFAGLLQMMVQKMLAEMIGTFAIVFAGIGSILLTEKFPTLFPAYFVPVIFGTTVLLMILAVGHISGAHFNPAVTLAFVAAKRFPASGIPAYWIGQFTGGLTAIILLAVIQKR